MKLFSRDEINYWLNTANVNPCTYLNDNMCSLLTMAYTYKLDITVDEVRTILGATPHPDPLIGAKYIWELD